MALVCRLRARVRECCVLPVKDPRAEDDGVPTGWLVRPARNFAEVVLTVDNADKLAPARLNDADVLDVTRRITRGAGSAYKINGEEVRAKDVQLLFADAGTGANSPALVLSRSTRPIRVP